MSDHKAVHDVRALVIRLLEDEQLEVKSQLSLITLNIKSHSEYAAETYSQSSISVTRRWLGDEQTYGSVII